MLSTRTSRACITKKSPTVVFSSNHHQAKIRLQADRYVYGVVGRTTTDRDPSNRHPAKSAFRRSLRVWSCRPDETDRDPRIVIQPNRLQAIVTCMECGGRRLIGIPAIIIKPTSTFRPIVTCMELLAGRRLIGIPAIVIQPTSAFRPIVTCMELSAGRRLIGIPAIVIQPTSAFRPIVTCMELSAGRRLIGIPAIVIQPTSAFRPIVTCMGSSSGC
ncbi:hypothetical protein J6590_082278 [Homalodisca vitripennis]|nr:hypothetical protein J6590_082278 [Homalodisca vitripennis]